MTWRSIFRASRTKNAFLQVVQHNVEYHEDITIEMYSLACSGPNETSTQQAGLN